MAMRSSGLFWSALLTATIFCSPAKATDFGGAGLSLNDLQVGGFVVVAPKYEGSDEYEARGFPIVAPSGLGGNTLEDGIVQFRGPDDLRFRLVKLNAFEFGPLVGWRFDREEDDARRLLGLGDVDGGVVVGAYAAYNLGLLRPFVSYHHQVSGDDTGAVIRFGTEVKTHLAPSLPIRLTAGATYADDDYTDAYFSISPTQSAASVAGLAIYDADSGIKDVFIGAQTDIALSQDWSLKLSGRYSHIVGDAADSPIVETEDQFFAGAGLTYRFKLQR